MEREPEACDDAAKALRPLIFALAGGHAVVLGSGPLALAIADGLAGARAEVTLIEPDDDRAAPDALVRLEASGCSLAVADFADSESLGAALDAVIAAGGTVDVLVSCVEGAPSCRPIAEIDDEEWRRVLDGTLGSAFHAARALLPGMIEAGRGRIVLVSSQLVLNPPWSSGAAFVAAKGGLLGLARHMAKEFGPQGIRTNAVIPGFTQREWDAIAESELAESALAAIPLGRLPDPAEPAALVLFLASDGAGYVNGATLQCNGGRSMA